MEETFQVAATRRIEATPGRIYSVFADYLDAHPRILPPSFFEGMTVEEGGYGAGTVVRVAGRFGGRRREMRGVVTEPEPGRRLVESYPDDRMVTAFLVEPVDGGRASEVTISTSLPRRPGIVGWLEERLVRRLLTRVYGEELDLLVQYLDSTGSPEAA